MRQSRYASCKYEEMIAVGISIRSGDLFLAGLTEPTVAGRPADAIDNAWTKVTPSGNLMGPEQLFDLKNQIQADLREWNVTSVGLLDTGKHAQWVYSQAHKRILSISAVMYACVEENIKFSVVKPGEAGKAALSPKLMPIDHSLFGLKKQPTYWTTGLGEAFAVGAYMINGPSLEFSRKTSE